MSELSPELSAIYAKYGIKEASATPTPAGSSTDPDSASARASATSSSRVRASAKSSAGSLAGSSAGSSAGSPVEPLGSIEAPVGLTAEAWKLLFVALPEGTRLAFPPELLKKDGKPVHAGLFTVVNAGDSKQRSDAETVAIALGLTNYAGDATVHSIRRFLSEAPPALFDGFVLKIDELCALLDRFRATLRGEAEMPSADLNLLCNFLLRIFDNWRQPDAFGSYADVLVFTRCRDTESRVKHAREHGFILYPTGCTEGTWKLKPVDES